MLANLGSSPWTVLSQGVALQADVSIGWASFGISCLAMLAWIPLKLRFGLWYDFEYYRDCFFSWFNRENYA